MKLLLEELDKYFVGQKELKQTLIQVFYYQFLKITNPHKSYPSPNVLIVGPTGNGKTAICQKLQDLVGIPFIQINALSLAPVSGEGYSLENHLYRAATQYEENYLNNVVIFIDEIDKLLFGEGSIRSWNQSLLHGLYSYMEKGEISLLPPDNTKWRREDVPASIPTKNIIFILAGVFDSSRFNDSSIGFTKDSQPTETLLYNDLLKYGVPPELLGRCTNILRVKPLIDQEILDVIDLKVNQIISEYKDMSA